MSKRITVKRDELVPGYYVAFDTDLGVVGFFQVKDHSEQYNQHQRLYGGVYADLDPITIWGLSRWRGNVGYRTRGYSLKEWLAEQPKGAQFRKDRDRTGWPSCPVEVADG